MTSDECKKKKIYVDSKQPEKPQYKSRKSAYGDEASICTNAGCVLRKKAKCFGFEGCPGFQGR